MNPKPRKWWIAGLLSLFVPGLGQTYNSEYRKGLLFFLIGIALAVLSGILMLNGSYHGWIGVVNTLYKCIAAGEAAINAKRIDISRVDPRVLRRGYMKFLSVFTCVILVPVFTYIFLYQAFQIPSGAMENTLLIGDHLLVNKYVYGVRIPWTERRVLKFRDVQHGDVVVFKCPATALSEEERKHHVRKDFIKRTVALPGDQVVIKNKRLYINGLLQTEPYAIYRDPKVIPDSRSAVSAADFQKAWERGDLAQHSYVRDNFGPVKVPAGCYFVMGDNRDGSFDSRFWGPLPAGLLIGKPTRIYFPSNRSQRL
jgi:signal peptidase I